MADYELAVIGGGPGGYVAAIHAGQSGIKTVLIEDKDIGGTCLNRGCIPTKAMLHSCEVLDSIKNAAELGIKSAEPQVDMPALYKYKDKVVKKLKSGVTGLLKANGVEVLKARAEFTGPHSLSCTGEGKTTELTASNIIIAAGSVPAIPPIEGLKSLNYWTSNTLLEENTELPESMIIIGGGVIGVECATILNDLGVEVTILEMLPRILPNLDPDIAGVLQASLEKEGVTVRTGVKVEKTMAAGGGVKVSISSEKGAEEVGAGQLMVAVGRKSRLDGLNLDAAGIKHERGTVPAGNNMQTNVPGVYAIGDITGQWQLAHAASAQGIRAVDHIAGRVNHTNMEVVPSCVYTRPEISAAGMSEKEAAAAGRETATGIFPFPGNSKAVITGETSGFIKIVSDAKTGAVLGGQIVGPRATELIAEIALAVTSELTIEEIGGLIHPHPTVSEAVMEAVHDIEGHSIHKMPKRR
jgi:dihydrolipoamide dehydrogenase